MRCMRRAGSVVMVSLVLACASPRPPAPPVPDPALRAALIERAAKDQADMQALAAHWEDSSYHRTLQATLVANAQWLDSVVSARGWPGIAVADSDGTQAAFLIAQHADSVSAAQRRFLTALRAAVAGHDAPPANLAYLEDRVRRADGRPQLYATQPDFDKQGNAVTPPVEAPESLDVRRARVGLKPMAEYLAQMNATNAQLRAMSPPPKK